MIQRISTFTYSQPIRKLNSSNNQVIADVTDSKKKDITFKGLFGIDFSHGSKLCFETADLVFAVRDKARAKKITDKEFEAPDGTKITFSDASLWQQYIFENKNSAFVDKYGDSRILCSVNGANVVNYSLAPYLRPKELQKGTADILLINYLPLLLEKM